METSIELNWDDIKDTSIDTVNTIVTNNVNVCKSRNYKNTVRHNNKVFSDRSLWTNRNICEKVTAKYAQLNDMKLSKNKNSETTYTFSNGETVCLKVRRNVHNINRNFSFTLEDLSTDYIAIFSYDGSTKTGSYAICRTNRISKYDMRNMNGYYLCPEKLIISQSIFNILINF